MEKKIDLECEYCGVMITENDHKCPNCGANCTKQIKKYKEQQAKIEEEEKNKKIEQSIKNTEDLENAMRKPVLIITAVVMILSIFIFCVIFQSIRKAERGSSEILENETIEVGYKEVAETTNYTFLLDSYELYEYVSDNFPQSYNTPDGYQKIAFHFQYQNTSNYPYQLGYSEVELTADDYKVEESSLNAGTFEKVISGKEKYPSFSATIIRNGEKFQGYVGFLVPKDKKELKFRFKNVKIVMDNPAYEEE